MIDLAVLGLVRGPGHRLLRSLQTLHLLLILKLRRAFRLLLPHQLRLLVVGGIVVVVRGLRLEVGPVDGVVAFRRRLDVLGAHRGDVVVVRRSVGEAGGGRDVAVGFLDRDVLLLLVELGLLGVLDSVGVDGVGGLIALGFLLLLLLLGGGGGGLVVLAERRLGVGAVGEPG